MHEMHAGLSHVHFWLVLHSLCIMYQVNRRKPNRNWLPWLTETNSYKVKIDHLAAQWRLTNAPCKFYETIKSGRFEEEQY